MWYNGDFVPGLGIDIDYICPECRANMNVHSRRYYQFSWNFFVKQFYCVCSECKYTCSGDFVSGFWSGYKSKFRSKEYES